MSVQTILRFVLNRLTKIAVLSLLSALTLVSAPASAQRASDGQEQQSPAPDVDARTAQTLTDAIESYNDGDYAAARESIAQLNLEKLSPYERGRVEQLFSNIAIAEENYAEARRHLELAISSGGLNEQELSSARYQLAITFIGEDRWQEGAAALESWFETAVNPNSAAYYLLAIAYYQQSDYDRALPPAIKSVELTDKPQENWLQLVIVLMIEKGDTEGAVPWAERLVEMAPDKKSHWLQLSSVYQEVDQYEKALAVTQLAYMAGLLSEDSEIRRLADLLVYNEIPYRCGQILERAIAEGTVKADVGSYEKLANCWVLAGEYDKSIEPFGRAAHLSANGDLYVRLGEVHVQRDDWAAAATALESGLSKGELRNQHYAELLMGIALFEQDKLAEARQWLERAATDERYRDQAEAYLQLIDRAQ